MMVSSLMFFVAVKETIIRYSARDSAWCTTTGVCAS